MYRQQLSLSLQDPAAESVTGETSKEMWCFRRGIWIRRPGEAGTPLKNACSGFGGEQNRTPAAGSAT